MPFNKSHTEDQFLENDEVDYVSKSAIKREKHFLRDMGARLMEIKPSSLDQLALGERLRDALDESKRITSHNARKRHLGFIAKLMQNQETESIQEFLDHLDSSSEIYNRRFHQLEKWRDRLINEGAIALTACLDVYPAADHQHLRQLVRNADKEAKQEKPPTAARKLFKYLRELDEAHHVERVTALSKQESEDL